MANEEGDPQLKNIRQNNDDLHRIHEYFQHLSKRKSNCYKYPRRARCKSDQS